jgi:hypothetical protein
MIVQPKAPVAQLLSEYSVFLPQVIDRVALLLTQPSGNRYHQQAERIEALTHCDSIPPRGLERQGKSLQLNRIELLDTTGYKILRSVSGRSAIKRNTAISPSTQESESERVLRALGVLEPARMPVQTHSVRRSFVTPGAERIYRTSSF